MVDGNGLVSRANLGRHSISVPNFVLEENSELDRRRNTSINIARRLSTTSQIHLPYGHEYHSQQHIPPSGAEFYNRFFLSPDETYGGPINERRLSIISEGNYSLDDDDDDRRLVLRNEASVGRKYQQRHGRVLFIVEPIFAGLFLLPILVLFWECGWNLVWILLNTLGLHSSTVGMNRGSEGNVNHYPIHVLLIPYFIAQILLLTLYLVQDAFYNFLKRRNYLIVLVLLKLHIFLLASIYIVQWVILWTIWDQYTPHEWYFELVLSFTSLFALIVLIGHLSDLVCAPFIVSYDSIDYCIHFGCPLLTRQISPWKINLINYLLYEVIITNIAVLTWRGFYHILDERLYPNDHDKSAWICIVVGYILYFPLMYFQSYMEYLNMKFEFWTFISINFPQLYRNIRHLFAFLSCVLLWRGIWLLYDSHITIFESHFLTYSLLYLVSFFFLALIQTSSSVIGPLSNIEDENCSFPLYPNCYVSIVARVLSRKR